MLKKKTTKTFPSLSVTGKMSVVASIKDPQNETLRVSGTLVATNDVTCEGHLSVGNSGLTVAGDTKLNGTLTVEQPTTLKQGLTVGGKVGVGTTDPKGSSLHAAGDLVLGDDVNGRKFILHPRPGKGDFLQLTCDKDGDWDWGKGITFRRDSGNVGIGTTTPEASLEVKGTMKVFGERTLLTDCATPPQDGEIGRATAPSDGFVVVVASVGDNRGLPHTDFKLEGFVEGTVYALGAASVNSVADQDWPILSSSFTMPVRKGETWYIRFHKDDRHVTAGKFHTYWMPLGQ